MTDETIFEVAPEELTHSTKLAEVIDFMKTNMGINPMSVYCQFTGKPCGRLYQEEIESLFDLNSDIETIADDLMIRTLASMRPSIMWNYMRSESLDDLMVKRPIETLAYLLNRLFQPSDYGKLPLAARLDDLHTRIRLFDFLFNEVSAADQTHLMQMLIEVDAKMNLTQQTIDLRAADFMLFPVASMEAFVLWHTFCMKRYERSQRLEEDQRRWMKGNTLARPAFFRTFMEAKPETKTAQGKRVKTAEQLANEALFRAVMAEAEGDSESPAPTPTPVAPAPSAPKAGVTKLPAFLIKKVAANG